MQPASLFNRGHTNSEEYAMPFDGSTLTLPPQTLLAAAWSAGLIPVPAEVLERHKALQLAEHRSSWFFRHRAVLQILQGGVLLAGLGAFYVLGIAGHVGWAMVVAAAALTMAFGTMVLPVRGPALWTERETVDLTVAPPAVARAAQLLKQQLPDAGFVVGELFQDRVRLDPYLVAEHRGARIVLGIWDGETVIESA
jgi:hypothetical protein